MHAIKLFSTCSIKRSMAVAAEAAADGAAEHAFIRGHPVHSQTVGDRKHLIGNAALRGPHTTWTHAKDLFMQREPALNLFTRIFRMHKPPRRQRQSCM